MKVAFFRFTFIVLMVPTYCILMLLGMIGLDKQAGKFWADWFALACGE